MGILYNVPDLKTWGFMAFVLLALIAFNELGRQKNGEESYYLLLYHWCLPLQSGLQRLHRVMNMEQVTGLTGLRHTLHWQDVSASC